MISAIEHRCGNRVDIQLHGESFYMSCLVCGWEHTTGYGDIGTNLDSMEASGEIIHGEIEAE